MTQVDEVEVNNIIIQIYKQKYKKITIKMWML